MTYKFHRSKRNKVYLKQPKIEIFHRILVKPIQCDECVHRAWICHSRFYRAQYAKLFHPSVRLFVTPRYCVKTAKHISYFSPHGIIAIRYDMIREFNVDRKAECGRFDLATRNLKKMQKNKKLKQTNSSENVRSKSKIREGSPNGTSKTMETRLCDTVEF